MLDTCVGIAAFGHLRNFYVFQIDLDHHHPTQHQCTLLTTLGHKEELLWRAIAAYQLYLE